MRSKLNNTRNVNEKRAILCKNIENLRKKMKKKKTKIKLNKTKITNSKIRKYRKIMKANWTP